MKVLVDECLPRKLKYSLHEHECQTVPEAGLAGEKNGRLLTLAETAGFHVFLSIDKGLKYQQNMTGRKIAVLIVKCKSNRFADVMPHISECLSIMATIQPGQVIRIGE